MFRNEENSRVEELENLEKNSEKSPSRKKYGFSYDSNKKYFK